MTFTNGYEAAPVTLKLGAAKVLKGAELKAGQFSFELKSRDGKVMSTAKNAADGSVTFSPNDTLTRAEAVTILARTLGSGLLRCDISATDESDIPQWSYESFQTMIANGIISGYPDGSIKPLAGITRAEAVKILYEIY